MDSSLSIETIEINRDGSIKGDDPFEQSRRAMDFRSLLYIGAPLLVEKWGGNVAPSTGLQEQEIFTLTACENYAQYRMTCDAIKTRRKMAYPPDWWEKMMVSGLQNIMLAKFDGGVKSADVDAIIRPLLGY
jgi:hypothetical protein